MATPTDCYSLRFEFSLKQISIKQDIAEFYLWMDGDGAEFGEAELQHLAAGGYAAWTGNVNQGHFSSAVDFEGVTAQSYLANGHVLAQGKATPTGAHWIGTASGASLPWETAMAVSLYTYARGSFVPNAKRKRGRFYLPPFSSSVLAPNNSGFYDDGSIAGLLGEMKDFTTDAQQTDVGVPTGHLSVFSRMDSTLRHVTQLSIDAKIDSQRRRQNRELAGHIEVDF